MLNLFLSTARAEETTTAWGSELVEKFVETPATTWIILLVIAALGAMLLLFGKTRKQWTAKTIAFAALSIALSFVLSCFRLYRMPTGGSITPGSMLPLMLFSAAFGVGPGMLAGFVYGVLQYLQGGWFLNVWQFLLDYLLAFAAIGLAGLAHNRKGKWLYFSIPLAAIGRAVCAILAGMMWVADTPVENLVIGAWHFNSPLLYSMVYNGIYLIPDTFICLLLAFLLAKPVMKVLQAK